MTDPANDPYGPRNEDADRQGNTAPDGDTVEAPEGLPWELNPAVERPTGNYATLAEAEEAAGVTTESTTSGATAPATGTAPMVAPEIAVTPSESVADAPATDAPVNEAGEPAPTATDKTVTTETEYEPD